MRTPTHLDRLDSLVAMARARALSALQLVGVPNFLVQTNAGLIVAAQTNLFETTSFLAKTTGRILVVAMMTNTVSNVDDSVLYQTTVDGAPTPGAPNGGSLDAPAGHLASVAAGTVFWIQSVAVGSSHTVGVLATNGILGHTVLTAPGFATVAVYELP